jgi:uncharacterized protein
MLNAETIIKTLALKQHPEGGWFIETYRSSEIIKKDSLPERFTGDRYFSTAIYFLLKENDISAFHRIKQDEIWHYHYGDSITIHTINKTGKYSKIRLGSNITNGETMQAVIPAGTLFAAEINSSKYNFSLAGCTVAPGFDFEDFEMPDRETLLKLYPEHKEVIIKLTT